MSFKTNRGFTLIELLVVIAIIGILSSVVLASLNTARDKGRDAAIKSSLQTVRVQSEIYYDDTNFGYGVADTADTAVADCNLGMFLDPTIAAALADVGNNELGTTLCVLNGTNNGQAQEWAIEVGLRDGTGWCTDYTGVAEATAYDGSGEGAGGATIDNGDADCN